MINYKKEFVEILQIAGVPVFYELFIRPEHIPSISYSEYNNIETLSGDTLFYSSLGFQVKVWARTIQEVASIAGIIDDELRSAGFRREFYGEYNDGNKPVAVIRYIATGYKR
jgi:hypothetical protein